MTNISDLEGIDQAIYVIAQIGGDTQNTFEEFSIYKKSENEPVQD